MSKGTSKRRRREGRSNKESVQKRLKMAKDSEKYAPRMKELLLQVEITSPPRTPRERYLGTKTPEERALTMITPYGL